ncbi:hypothetical protein HDR58_03175 [bacterium]|nr:hypothetical protein [bacterium]
MKYLKLVLPIIGLILSFSDVYAFTPQEGMAFFDKYKSFANTYDEKLLELYSPDVKVIREVVKPSGGTESVNIPSKRFFHELKIGQKTAKLKKYQNKYKNVIVQEVPNGVKISAERQPSKETYWLKMYQIVESTESGPKITEEMMQTKVQSFLKMKK